MKLNPFAAASLSLVFAIVACGSDNSGTGGTGTGGTDSGKGGSDSGKGGSDSGKGGSDTGKGGSDTGKGGSDTGKGGTSSMSGSYTGCSNGVGFACKSSAALEACFDDDQCDGCSPDPTACESSGKGGSDTGKGGSDTGKGGSNTGKGGSDTGKGGSSSGGKKETGQQCQENDECVGEACITANGADFGYCSNVCESFADCPSFWDCEKVGNATSKYCVQDD